MPLVYLLWLLQQHDRGVSWRGVGEGEEGLETVPNVVSRKFGVSALTKVGR